MMTKLLPGKSGILPLSGVLQSSFSGSALVLLNCKITVEHGLKKKSEIKLFYGHTGSQWDDNCLLWILSKLQDILQKKCNFFEIQFLQIKIFTWLWMPVKSQTAYFFGSQSDFPAKTLLKNICFVLKPLQVQAWMRVCVFKDISS